MAEIDEGERIEVLCVVVQWTPPTAPHYLISYRISLNYGTFCLFLAPPLPTLILCAIHHLTFNLSLRRFIVQPRPPSAIHHSTLLSHSEPLPSPLPFHSRIAFPSRPLFLTCLCKLFGSPSHFSPKPEGRSRRV